MGSAPAILDSVCIFCGSSDAADPDFLADAAALGAALAAQGLKMIYGGGGVGLMGACARAAHEAGGHVLGVIPAFLTSRERALEVVETVVVESMHQRKQIMFESSDAFVILPGGVGTLEEVVEILSWRRLDLHAKPVVFYNRKDFWQPLFDLFEHTIAQRLTPPEFRDAWAVVDRVEDIIPTLRRLKVSEDDAAPAARRVT